MFAKFIRKVDTLDMKFNLGPQKQKLKVFLKQGMINSDWK